MTIRPILSSLRRHRIPASLIVLEVALACAVLCNAVFMIGQRLADMRLPNAIDEAALSVVTLQGTDGTRAGADIPRNIAALRRIRGVDAVAVTSTLPLSNSNWGWSFSPQPGGPALDPHNRNVSLYFLGSGAERALGLRLVEGRYFNADEIADSHASGSPLPDTHVVLVTASLARHLWPDVSPLGHKLYAVGHDYTVVGVLRDVLRPFLYGGNANYDAVFFPMSAGGSQGSLNKYVLRGAPADRDRIAHEAEQVLADLNPTAVAKGRSYVEMRSKYFADMSAMAWMLVLVCVVMVAVTVFGIVGLTSFWVAQRRRQIGIRRAVGATRGQILAYFRTENFLLTTAGVAIGMVVAFGINLYLMQHYEMSRLPWYYLPGGAIALWLIGQLAVFGPALRAAAVPPVVATRSE